MKRVWAFEVILHQWDGDQLLGMGTARTKRAARRAAAGHMHFPFAVVTPVEVRSRKTIR